MLARWWKISVILGALLFSGSLMFACFQSWIELRYANVGSYLNWVPLPPTDHDALILSIHTGWMMLGGIALMVLGLEGYHRKKSN
jgi:hypothetical protein